MFNTAKIIFIAVAALLAGCAGSQHALLNVEESSIKTVVEGDVAEAKVKLLAISFSNRFGYITPDGNLAIEPLFEAAHAFGENGLAVVKRNGRYGVINTRGKYIVEPKFDRAFNFTPNGLALVKIDDKYGYINETGEYAILPSFEDAWDFGEHSGFATVKVPEGYGYIDAKGDFVIEPKFDHAWGFGVNGLAPVLKLGKKGYINLMGEYVIAPKYDKAQEFAPNGLAAAVLFERAGYIDEKGRFVIPPMFDDAWFFSYGFAGVKLDGKYGFVSETGELIADTIYLEAGTFTKSGLAPVKVDGAPERASTGYINTEGRFAIEPQFADAWNFSAEGIAMVRLVKNGDLGFINTRGEIIIEPQFVDGKDFKDGLAAVKTRDGNWTYVNAKGELLTYTDSVCGVTVLKNRKGGIIFPKKTVEQLCE
jgi:hypothetical protein